MVTICLEFLWERKILKILQSEPLIFQFGSAIAFGWDYYLQTYKQILVNVNLITK
jgi:hypothetical protein